MRLLLVLGMTIFTSPLPLSEIRSLPGLPIVSTPPPRRIRIRPLAARFRVRGVLLELSLIGHLVPGILQELQTTYF